MTSDERSIQLQAGDALVVVDVQVDFLPGGSLAVPDGDQVVPVLKGYIAAFRRAGLPVVATRDWHPPDHCSFQTLGGPWPPHCVAGSHGAAFAPGLDLPEAAWIVSKATSPKKDAYSGFQGTGLDRLLRKARIARVFVGGLATDYCVLNTVRDALGLGYRAVLLMDAIRPVEARAGDGERAVAEMLGAGAIPATRERIER
jgi:nicotinamidase/pyrazinamidase